MGVTGYIDGENGSELQSQSKCLLQLIYNSNKKKLQLLNLSESKCHKSMINALPPSETLTGNEKGILDLTDKMFIQIVFAKPHICKLLPLMHSTEMLTRFLFQSLVLETMFTGKRVHWYK